MHTKQIPLTRGFVAIVDADDYEHLSAFRWHAVGRAMVYAMRRGRKGEPKAVPMHRHITKAKTGLDVDHLNWNTLDNRKANLRVCSRSANIGNAKPGRRNNKTGYKG